MSIDRLRLALPWLVGTAVIASWLAPRTAAAWAIGSQINETGCHEPITAEALRIARATLATAPVVAPTRDEAALIDDVLFAPPLDFVNDLAGMTLLLGVRDNDLKGVNPLSSLDLVQVHGDPTTQQEHCIRRPGDEGTTGDQAALAACRAFIRDTATAALDGLDGGMVDPTNRMPFTLYVALAGEVTAPLPLFYVKMGAAMHALEDGFTHTYRSADGMTVTVVLNWIDLVAGGVPYDEARDGPAHRAELDHCWQNDPLVARNFQLATLAASELLTAALDPALTRDQKIARFDAVTAKYLGYQPGCTFDNQWCDAAEAKVTEAIPGGCNAGGGVGWSGILVVGLVGLGLAASSLRRRRGVFAGAALLLVGVLGMSARAENAAPSPVLATVKGTEPGRDEKTPSAAEIRSVRKDKQLGSVWGFTGSIGASVDRTAAVGTIGVRYRLNENWMIGVDAGWNPWITTSPVKERAGVAMAYATLIRRFPMRYDRVNLRSSLHLGASTLLFDVYGAPMYSTGAYLAISPLGIDYDLGGSVRLVVDPVEFALPVPLIGQLPLYYEQFRFMIGVQIGG